METGKGLAILSPLSREVRMAMIPGLLVKENGGFVVHGGTFGGESLHYRNMWLLYA